MIELIGTCHKCGKEIYCDGGFFNGVDEHGKLFCFSCQEKDKR